MSSGQVSETVSAIERELGRIWAADASGPARVRASMMNFVVATSGHDLERERAATDELSRTHAGRTFLVWVDPRLAPWDVGADVAAVCRKSGDAELCSDRIELAFGVSAAARAASVVGALSLGEVPTVLEVAHGAHEAIVDQLAPRAGRVVVDTAFHTVGAAARIARATEAPLADRNFVRTFTFRDLVARLFDVTPSRTRQIRGVEIARTPGFRVEPAALLFGWLGSRLGWRFEAKDRAIDAAGKPVALSLDEDARSGLGPGELLAVRFTMDDYEPASIERSRESPRVLCWRCGDEVHEHALGFRDETWVLVKALDDKRSDRVYREAVLAGAAWEAS